MAVEALQDFISLQTESGNAVINFVLLQFIIKQLQLVFKSKEGQRYSPALMTIAFMWQLTSTSLYKK